MKVEYKNIKVNRKTGTEADGYLYTGTLQVVIINTIGVLWWEKTHVRSHNISFTLLCSVSMDRDIINYSGYVSGPGISKIRGEDMDRSVRRACMTYKLKSEDECCTNPDLVVCNTYPLHDIILCYILDNYEVQDYCFNKVGKSYHGITGSPIDYSFGYIDFKDDSTEYKYTVKLCETVKEYACLNCNSIIKRDEEYAIKNFNKWFKAEQKEQKRIKKAKEICERNSFNE